MKKTKLKLLFLALLGLAFLPTATNAMKYSSSLNPLGTTSSFYVSDVVDGYSYQRLQYYGVDVITCPSVGSSRYPRVNATNGIVSDYQYCPSTGGPFYVENVFPKDYNNSAWADPWGFASFYHPTGRLGGGYLDQLISVYEKDGEIIPHRLQFRYNDNGNFEHTFPSGEMWELTHQYATFYGPIFYDPTSIAEPKIVTYFANTVLKNIVPTWKQDLSEFMFYDFTENKLWVFDNASPSVMFKNWLAENFYDFYDAVSKGTPIGYYDIEYNPAEGGYQFFDGIKVKRGAFHNTDGSWDAFLNKMKPSPESGDTGTQTGSLAEQYNQCVSYYSDMKNLAYYSQKCGEDPADDETLNRVKVDSWNAESEAQTVIDQLTGGNKNKCGRFANAKKQYKEKYGVEFENFYKEFGKYARTPEAVDIQSLCKGVELEHGSPGNANATSDTPFTNKVKSWKLFGWVSDNVLDPVSNFAADSIIGFLGKKDGVVCEVEGKKYTAENVLSDEQKLHQLSGVDLIVFQTELFEKYKGCSDETHYVRNHLGDIWNKNFKGQGLVASFVAIIKEEYDKGLNFFPFYSCSYKGFGSSEYDKLLWVLFIVFALYLYKLFL